MYRRGARRRPEDSSGGRGRGRGNKPGIGPGGNCICPKCGHRIPHKTGERCLDVKCPECGSNMIRE